MLQFELKLNGWKTLPDRYQSYISIYKVGGSLTNAVFFVSCPIDDSKEKEEEDEEKVKSLDFSPPPPTVLLRIYGPSSGSLISRKHELHLLHTLSLEYSIGPLVLGTFHNGRVEEYFESRPLSKEEIRDSKISAWIATRMRELHSVDLRIILKKDEENRSNAARSHRSTFPNSPQGFNRPKVSQRSIRINSSQPIPSSVNQPSSMSWSSSYSSESDSIPLPYTDRLTISSPNTYPSVLSSTVSNLSRESYFVRKKRSKDSLRSTSTHSLIKSDKIKVGAWENIIRWQREAEKVIQKILRFSNQELQLDHHHHQHTTPKASKLNRSSLSPLSSIHSLLKFLDEFDLPKLILQTKVYRDWVRRLERLNGKSPRVFSHNDTQCGNLLLRQLDQISLNERAHEQILVIDFEYASANPRAFDIANHFHEWCADYHHPTLSYSLRPHGLYPTLHERKRFYRAYLNQDRISPLSLDESSSSSDFVVKEEVETGEEEEEIERLEEEVKVWSPVSDVMWSLWGLVQAQDDIEDRMERWKNEKEEEEANEEGKEGEGKEKEKEKIKKGRSMEEIEFDYLSYSLERVQSFRKIFEELKLI
ncbi:kinase-like domain-containing protein [Melampsora americana]|nr:kinase-like domain-containing protein [Melampsora americana]